MSHTPKHHELCGDPMGCYPDCEVLAVSRATRQANNDGGGQGKQSNPKDAIGSAKLALGLVPDTIKAHVALAFLEGALKYGRYNWRIAGVRASIYHDALERHLMKWWNGETKDPHTRVRHLASIIACAGILLDAELCGKLEDDRPPSAPIGDFIDKEAVETAAHMREVFKDHNPRQFTIADSMPTLTPFQEPVWLAIDPPAPPPYRDVQYCHDYMAAP